MKICWVWLWNQEERGKKEGKKNENRCKTQHICAIHAAQE